MGPIQPDETKDSKDLVARLSPLLLLRIALLMALAATTALALDYASADSAFCGPNSGCAALRHTALAHLWGSRVSLPQVGLLGFATLYALSLSRASKALIWLGIATGLCGAALLAAQAFYFKEFCWLCVTTDVAAITAGLACLWGLYAPERLQQRTPLTSVGFILLGALSMLAPSLWPTLRPAAKVPEGVRALYQSDKINVVEFADFECPFCRDLHKRLRGLLEPYGDRVRFQRLNMPLSGHRFARDAALASICVESSPRHPEFVEFLFSTPDLAIPALEEEVARLGLKLADFQRCRVAPETNARLEREIRVFRDAGLSGLPTTYIGGRRILGAQPDETFRDALQRAEHGADEHGIPGWAYILAVLVLGAVIVQFTRHAQAADGREASRQSRE